MTNGQQPTTTVPTGMVVLLLVVVAAAGLTAAVRALLDHPPGSDADGGTVATEEVSGSAVVGVAADGFTVWARNDDGTPVRWDPCTPVDLVLRDDDAPAGWRDDLDVALATLEDATGMRLRVAGTTDEPPDLTRPAYQPDRYGERWAPVLLAWVSPGEGDLPLRDSDRGLAIPVAVGVDGDRTYVTGQVLLNADRDDLRVGADDRAVAWRATLLHELGHLLGLAHVDDPDELMARSPGTGPVELGPGDRAGLTAIGRDAGCREAPAPQPVTIPEPMGELDLHRAGR